MSASTIEWTQNTWNPTTGCHHVSAECENCYAEVFVKRGLIKKYPTDFNKVLEHPDELDRPYSWKKPRTVFVNSMSDLFHHKISHEFRTKIFDTMNDTPQHTYQILTKRHKKLGESHKDYNWSDNIWMGVSVGTQKATKRIDPLRTCDAKHKFLSVEPLLEEIYEMDLTGIDWVIVGGESGQKARPMKKEWVLKVKSICDEQNVPFFFKQWGMNKFNPISNDPTINDDHRYHSKGGSMIEGKVYWTNPTIKDFTIPTLKLFDKDYLIMDELKRDDLELNTIWELKSYLPIADDESFKKLKEDIRANGMNDPILYILTDDKKKLVIEGHTRLKAALELSKKLHIPTKEIANNFKSLDEIKYWMLEHQINRRNLTKIERIRYAYQFKDNISNLARENLSKAGKGEKVEAISTNYLIGKMAGVSESTIKHYAKIINEGSEALKRQVAKGELSIDKAYREAKFNPINKKPKKTASKTTSFEFYNNVEAAQEALLKGDVNLVLITKDDKINSNKSFNEAFKNKIAVVNLSDKEGVNTSFEEIKEMIKRG